MLDFDRHSEKWLAAEAVIKEATRLRHEEHDHLATAIIARLGEAFGG